MLRAGSFDIYPNAFSNYTRTKDSIPSILNGRLLKRLEEFLYENDRRPVLHQNKYFDHYRSKGYGLRVYQSDYLQYASGASDTVRVRDYRSNSLKALHNVLLPWTDRLRQLFVVYLQSDQFWWSNWTSVTPSSLHPDKLRLGPIAFQHLWPEQVIADYAAAERSSLFFVHVLTPHFPYVYNADGSFSNMSEWNEHTDQEFTDSETTAYTNRYRRYCGQVQFVATQLERLLTSLRNTGLYDSTTIVLHGDHGSRLRLLRAEDEKLRQKLLSVPGPTLPASRFDYTREPEARDLLNRFSALLAIKRPGAASAQVIGEPGSVLLFLQRAFLYAPQADSEAELKAAYLFDPQGTPKAIPAVAQAFTAATENPIQDLREKTE